MDVDDQPISIQPYSSNQPASVVGEEKVGLESFRSKLIRSVGDNKARIQKIKKKNADLMGM